MYNVVCDLHHWSVHFKFNVDYERSVIQLFITRYACTLMKMPVVSHYEHKKYPRDIRIFFIKKHFALFPNIKEKKKK